MENYNDIIHLSRPISKRPKLSKMQRAAQFAPFAALTGYEENIKETARITEKRIEINEELKNLLDFKLQIIQDKILEKPKVEITYYIPDLKKDGGKYVTVKGNVLKIDLYKNIIKLSDNIDIPINEIIDINYINNKFT